VSIRLTLARVVVLLGVGWNLHVAAQSKPSAPAPAAQAGKPAPAAKVGPVAPPATDADKIKSALAAAPAAISKDATVMDMPSMKVLKKGTNGWTCIPDGPSPGVDPMCLDKNGMAWADAWMNHKDPPKDKMAIAYMLVGGSDASNTDPFATTPKSGDKWVDTGPHLMVLNIGDHFDGYPTTATNTKAPYVMFANTPYAHLMIPVK
jgi:hypothetical protein